MYDGPGAVKFLWRNNKTILSQICHSTTWNWSNLFSFPKDLAFFYCNLTSFSLGIFVVVVLQHSVDEHDLAKKMVTLFRVNTITTTTAITRLQFYCWCCLIVSSSVVVVAVEGAWGKDNPEGKVKNTKVSDCTCARWWIDCIPWLSCIEIPFSFSLLFMFLASRIYGPSMTSLS